MCYAKLLQLCQIHRYRHVNVCLCISKFVLLWERGLSFFPVLTILGEIYRFLTLLKICFFLFSFTEI